MRLNTGYFTHPKTVKLFLALGTDAFWIPPRLWCWAANHRADGNLEGMSAGEIAMHVGYSGNAQAMLGALLDCVFLDPEPLRIHDWDEHNAYHAAFAEKARLAAAARWGKKKEPKKKEETEIRQGQGASITQAMLGASPDPNHYEQRQFVDSPTGEQLAKGYVLGRKVLAKLNLLTKSSFRETADNLDPIAKRLIENEYDVNGMITMVDRQAKLWRDDPKLSQGLTPRTLFGDRFSGYYGQRDKPIPSGNGKPRSIPDHSKGF